MPLELEKLNLLAMTQMIISIPMLFAAAIGGLAGGLLRLFKSSKFGFPRAVRFMMEGMLVGVVAVAMLLAGLLCGAIAKFTVPPQLILSFGFAAAAGSVGAHFLDQAVNRPRQNRA